MNKDVFTHYQVGILAMDNEHWALIEGLEEVHKFVLKFQFEDAYKKIAEIKQLMIIHFEEEESLMKKIEFPFLHYHQVDHKRALLLLEKIYKNFPQIDYHKDCVKPVERLMMTHFDTMDSQYVSYYKVWILRNGQSGESYTP